MFIFFHIGVNRFLFEVNNIKGVILYKDENNLNKSQK